jgi:hypothetical protein
VLDEENRVPSLHAGAKDLLLAEKGVPSAESFATGACDTQSEEVCVRVFKWREGERQKEYVCVTKKVAQRRRSDERRFPFT